MASNTKGSGGNRPRENVPVPSQREASNAGKLTQQGNPAGGRVLEQQRQAQQGKPGKK